MTKLKKSTLARGLAVFSAATTIGGLLALTAFESTPGEGGAVPTIWPHSSNIKIHGDRPELLVFAHPSCGCTNATVSELARVEASRPAKLPLLAVTFVVFRPGKDSTWQLDSLKSRTVGIPNARFVWDDGGAEAKRFGAGTSGVVMLYGADGRLQFHGGITGARGHEGENFGLSELRGLLQTSRGSVIRAESSKVFGCALASTSFLAENVRTISGSGHGL
jgi:hypothetical protein